MNEAGKETPGTSYSLLFWAVMLVLIGLMVSSIGTLQKRKVSAEMISALTTSLDKKYSRAHVEKHAEVSWIVVEEMRAAGQKPSTNGIGITVFYPANLVVVESVRWVSISDPASSTNSLQQPEACEISASCWRDGKQQTEVFRLKTVPRQRSVNLVGVDPGYLEIIRARVEDRSGNLRSE